MEAIFHVCGAGGPQLKRNPLGCSTTMPESRSRSRLEDLAALFREAGSAHHRAFASTNGDDPDWPTWYAEYLAPRLQKVFGRPFDARALAEYLKAMDAEHRAWGGQEPWPEFYARTFRSELVPG